MKMKKKMKFYPFSILFKLTTRKSKKRATYIEARQGDSLFREGKYLEALNIYSEVPQDESAHASKAACYIMLGKYSEAIEEYSKALELDKHVQNTLCNPAMAFITTEEFDLAVRDLLSLDWSNRNYLEFLNYAQVKENQALNKDDYATKGFDQNASIEEVEEAYRKKALKQHSILPAITEENMKKYKEVEEAHSVLEDSDKEVEEAHTVLEDSDKEVMGDPDKRALYERQRLKQSMQVSAHTQGCEHPNYYHITYLLYLKVICSL